MNPSLSHQQIFHSSNIPQCGSLEVGAGNMVEQLLCSQTLARILFILTMSVDEQLEQRLLTRADAFKRTKTKKFEHYTLKDKLMVNRAINSVKEYLLLELGDTFGVEDYVTIT